MLSRKGKATARSPEGSPSQHKEQSHGAQSAVCHPMSVQLQIWGNNRELLEPHGAVTVQGEWAEPRGAAQMCGAEADGFSHAEIYDLLKSP